MIGARAGAQGRPRSLNLRVPYVLAAPWPADLVQSRPTPWRRGAVRGITGHPCVVPVLDVDIGSVLRRDTSREGDRAVIQAIINSIANVLAPESDIMVLYAKSL